MTAQSSANRQSARAAGAVMLALVLGQGFGLIRNMLIAGACAAADSYVLPDGVPVCQAWDKNGIQNSVWHY